MPSMECAEPGCERPGAFRTTSKPTWCDPHITAILRRGGLEPLEPFPGTPRKWRLTRCLACGCEAHYRLEYTLDKNAHDEPTCRACYWQGWADDTRRLQGLYADKTPVPVQEARKTAERNGYEYLRPLTEPSLRDDPHHVRCLYCGRLSAQRLADIGWGCQCQVNPKRGVAASGEGAAKPSVDLFKVSQAPAVRWWDDELNSAADWHTVTPKSRRVLHWRCPDCGERFQSRVVDIAWRPECPVCEPRRRAAWSAKYEAYRRTTVAQVPELLSAWADDEDPTRAMVAGDWMLRRFRCPQGHHPRLSPLTYLQSGCPHCRGQRTAEEMLAAIEVDPAAFGMNPEIASQWHPTRNGELDPKRISPGSRRTVWWREESCGHEWQATPAEREKRQRLRCPECRTILDSLAYHFPVLSEQWSPANPLTSWQVRPSATLELLPQWTCTEDASHVWQASLTSRTEGAGCPMCRQVGKSAVELRVLEAARARFGNATSGKPFRDPAFKARAVWHPDVTVDLPSGRTLVIEYDGSYWHGDKADVDTVKSLDLLAAGHLLVRLREHPLPPLPVASRGYNEVVVYAAAFDPTTAVRDVAAWVDRALTGP